MSRKVYSLLISLFIATCSSSSASEKFVEKKNNFYSFSTQQKLLSEELLKTTPEAYRNHPDLGKLPVDAPCKSCYEDIAKREGDYRYFVVNGSRGAHFFQQQSLGDINYKDVNGDWREVNYRLQQPTVSGEFHAPHQPFPVTIDLNRKYSSITGNGYGILFNQGLELYHIDVRGKITPLGTPDWSNYTAGEDGIRVSGFYPGVDLEMIVNEGKIKTNFILQARLNFTDGWIVMKQKFNFNGDLKFDGSLALKNENGKMTGDIPVINPAGNKVFVISNSNVYDSNEDNPLQIDAGTEFNAANEFFVYVPLSWLNNPALTYPVIIDPLVSNSGNLAQAAITGSGFNALCFTGGCNYVMPPIAVPAACTVTGLNTTFSYTASNTCRMKDGGIRINLGACRAPYHATLNVAYTNPSNTLGTAALNASMFTHLSGCIPAAQCASYNMNFTMDFFRCTNDNTGGCTSTCISAGSAWVITIEGRTVQLDTITAGQIMCTGGNASLSATASYGVGPYAYVWTPGPIAGQNVVVSPAGNQVYTCTVTDACGNTSNNTSAVTVTGSAPATVTISPSGTVCAGSSVTLTATPGNGGSSPSYQWFVAGNPIASATSASYTFAPLNGNDSVSVEITSNSGCASPATAAAWIIATPTSMAGVNYSTVPVWPGPFCAGNTITFTANPLFGSGVGSPVYQWYVNGFPIGGNSTTFSTSILNNGDLVRVELFSSLTCPSPYPAFFSRGVPIRAMVTPTVNILQNIPSPFCNGTNVTFTADTLYGWSVPTIQWTVNGVNTVTGLTFSSSTLNNGDSVGVSFTSTHPCATISTVTDYVIVQVLSNSPPVVNITQSPSGLVCAGLPITFDTSGVVNGGAAPTFQWFVNGVSQGPLSATSSFTTSSLANNDWVKLRIQSSSTCAVPPDQYDSIQVTIQPSVAPNITIVNPPGTVCSGDNVTLNTVVSGQGLTPAYQWNVNGTNVSTANTYTQVYTLTSTVIVTLTSSLSCAVPTTDADTIQITVTSPLVPSVTITVAPNDTICQGDLATFTAAHINGGTPSYQWYEGATAVGANSATYSTSALPAGSTNVSVTITPTGCVTTATANSNVIGMTVVANVAPSVTNIAQAPASPCPGTPVSFTPAITNGGASPVYNWYVNNVLTFTGPIFTSSSLTNGDVVKVTLISSLACINPDSASRSTIANIQPPVIPSVNVTFPSGIICPGTNVVFTADTLNAGTAPSYQWQVNGVNAGANSRTYNYAPVNGDVVRVILTSNAICVSPATDTGSVTVTVSPNVMPTATINILPDDTICENTAASFTVDTTNAGTGPTYQWQVNYINAGTGPTFSTTFSGTSTVSVVVTSNAPCVLPATAGDTVTITTITTVVPTVSIATTPSTTICMGDTATFRANITNGGAFPTYQWQVNGTSVGTNIDTLALSTLGNGDIVSVILTTSANCAIPFGDTDQVTMTVNNIVPSVSFTASPTGAICQGTNVTFTATPVNGGAAPAYQWYVGPNPVGTNSTTFSSTTLNNNDIVSVTMTSNAQCANPAQVLAPNYTANVIQYVTPSVLIASNPSGTICVGNPVTFTASPTNGGTPPTYQWQLNGGSIAGATSNPYTHSPLVNGDVVTVIMTSSEPCLTQPTATSNQIVIATAAPLQVQVSLGSTVCPGVPVVLNAQAIGGVPPYSYGWSNGAGADSTIIVAPLITTNYVVTVSDICGSTPASGSVLINVYPSPDADFAYSPINPSTLAPQVTFTDLSNAAASWTWNFGDDSISYDQNPSHSFDFPGTYLVQLNVQSADGCLDSVTYTVIVKDEIALYVPNSFTPDGDGHNDLFTPMGYNVGPYTLTIYDRWGGIIFEGNELKSWNGNLPESKEPAPVGCYVYRIYLLDAKYSSPVMVGLVTVVR